MLTIGYIGNGKSTNRYHLPFALKNEHIRVKTIYARSLPSTQWKEQPSIQYVDRLEELLEDPEVELVVICTHLDTHVEFAKKVLESGKHVLVEKPFAPTAKEAKELFEIAGQKNLFIQCYQNRRYDSDFLTVQKVIESGVLGELLEVEMHYDYFRPEIPESAAKFSRDASYLYGHGCHTVDQVLAYFGNPEKIHYDVRQLLGTGRMNDYFDLDFYYGSLKVSVKSSYFRVQERPSFVVTGKKGSFVKQTKDRQEEHLKLFYMPVHADFGIDSPEQYGVLTYIDDQGRYHQERVISEVGDYSCVYEDVYQTIVHGKEKAVKDDQTIRQIEILEEGTAHLK